MTATAPLARTPTQAGEAPPGTTHHHASAADDVALLRGHAETLLVTARRWPLLKRWQGGLSWLLAWEERRNAAACCKDLMQVREALLQQQPELSGRALYGAVVAQHLGGDAAAAERVLQHAEESYAIWPVTRALSLRDVAHYLAVAELNAAHEGVPWVHAGTRRLVNATIPGDL